MPPLIPLRFFLQRYFSNDNKYYINILLSYIIIHDKVLLICLIHRLQNFVLKLSPKYERHNDKSCPLLFFKGGEKKEIPIGNYCVNLVRRSDNYTITVSQFQSTSFSVDAKSRSKEHRT